MNRCLLGTLFTRLVARAGVHANPHRFRHTFATWAIENHAPNSACSSCWASAPPVGSG